MEQQVQACERILAMWLYLKWPVVFVIQVRQSKRARREVLLEDLM